MTRSARRLATAAALPLATGGLLVALAVPAGAVNESAPPAFGANALGSLVRITGGPPGMTGEFRLLQAGGTAVRNSAIPTGDLATADSGPGGGTLMGQTFPGPGGASANNGEGPTSATASSPLPDTPPEFPIEGDAGDFTAMVDPETLEGSSTGSFGTITGPSLATLFGAEGEQLTAGIDALTTGVSDAITEIDMGLAQLPPNPLPTDAIPVVGGLPVQDARALRAALAELQATLEGLTDASVLEIVAPAVAHEIQQPTTSSDVTAIATSDTGDISFLGGLASIDSFTNRATATVNNQPGGASADATAGLGDFSALNGLIAGGFTADGLMGTDVPPALTEELQAGMDQFNAGIAQLGLQVQPAAEEETAAPDGKTASARASGLLISMTPPGEEESTLEIAVGDAAVAVQSGDAAPTVGVAQAAPTRELAATGTTALGGAAGMILVGAAGLAWRRRQDVTVDEV